VGGESDKKQSKESKHNTALGLPHFGALCRVKLTNIYFVGAFCSVIILFWFFGVLYSSIYIIKFPYNICVYIYKQLYSSCSHFLWFCFSVYIYISFFCAKLRLHTQVCKLISVFFWFWLLLLWFLLGFTLHGLIGNYAKVFHCFLCFPLLLFYLLRFIISLNFLYTLSRHALCIGVCRCVFECVGVCGCVCARVCVCGCL